MLSNAGAASLGPSPEDRYVATRDAAIARFSSIHDAGRFDDAAKKDEETARADLQAQMSAILGELNRNGADGWYVEPKAHIIITTQAILRALAARPQGLVGQGPQECAADRCSSQE
jgi:hypothetical protein